MHEAMELIKVSEQLYLFQLSLDILQLNGQLISPLLSLSNKCVLLVPLFLFLLVQPAYLLQLSRQGLHLLGQV